MALTLPIPEAFLQRVNCKAAILAILCAAWSGTTAHAQFPNLLPIGPQNYSAASVGPFAWDLLASDDGTVIYGGYFRADGATGADADGDLVYFRSPDGGKSWDPLRTLNGDAPDPEITRGDGMLELATDQEGGWMAVWVSFDQLAPAPQIPGNMIWTAYSSDDGVTWSYPVSINTTVPAFEPDPDTDGSDTTPHVVHLSSENSWLVVFYSTERPEGTEGGTDGGLLVSKSFDNGATWSVPRQPFPQFELYKDVASDREITVSRTKGTIHLIARIPRVPLGTGNDIRYWCSTDGGGGWN